MTENQYNKLVEEGDKFWIEFSKLCAKYVSKFPENIQDEVTMYLGDRTSIYGSRYDSYIKRKSN